MRPSQLQTRVPAQRKAVKLKIEELKGFQGLLGKMLSRRMYKVVKTSVKVEKKVTPYIQPY